MLAYIHLPPRWKIRREFRRANKKLGEKTRDLIDELHEPFFNYWHDWRRTSIINVSEGAISLMEERVAVFLIYQPNGIPESVFKTCLHLARSGYSPLVVCNSPLSSADRTRLLEISWMYMIRPNYGHDFGGYRDAVWFLNKLKFCPRFLLFLNDSIWFPIASNSTVIEKMESSQADYVGTFEYTYGRGKPHLTHYPSYLFMIKHRISRSKEFHEFWRTYRVSSRKRKVIRRGEIGLSNMLISSRFTSASIFPRNGFLEALCRMDPLGLKDELAYIVCIDQKISKAKQQLLETFRENQNWAAECREFLIVNSQYNWYFYLLPVFFIEKLGVPFVKKLRTQKFVTGQRMILSAAHSEKFENAIFDYVLEEMESNVSSANF